MEFSILKEYICKARKDYECDYCGGKIKKGDKYRNLKGKEPKYKLVDNWDEPEEQIGVNYYNVRTHIKCNNENDDFYDWFVCSSCKEKSDNPEEYMWRMSELANPNEDEEFWICRECRQDEIDDKIRMKYE